MTVYRSMVSATKRRRLKSPNLVRLGIPLVCRMYCFKYSVLTGPLLEQGNKLPLRIANFDDFPIPEAIFTSTN
jgi:hypothetical protein